MLKLAKDLELPLEAVTRTHGILAMRGAGKSNVMVALFEEMHDAGLPAVVIDIKGDWWGVRYSANKTGEGLPVYIFGGLHADLPLLPGHGVYMAELVVARRLTCVLDLSEMTKGEQTRFLIDFADRLFRLKNQHRFPLHLMLDEADEYIPQKLPPGQKGDGAVATCVGIFSRLVKQGRNRGLGITMATQRSAVLNWDVLSQLDTLIAMRTTAKLDRDAIRNWVEYHAISKELVASLPELDDGEGWIWSPNAYKLMAKVKFRRRRTFDSGATPEVGMNLEPPGRLTAVDLAAISEQMTEAIEEAKTKDPTELTRRIKELERQLAAKPSPAPPAPPKIEYEEIIVVPDEVWAIHALLLEVSTALSEIEHAGHHSYVTTCRAAEALAKAKTAMAAAKPTQRPTPDRTLPKPNAQPAPARPTAAPQRTTPPPTVGDVKLGGGEHKVLNVLAQYPDGLVRNRLAFTAGYSKKASTIDVIIGKLRRAGLVEPSAGQGGKVKLTPEGIDAAGGIQELPTGDALIEYWHNHKRVGAGEKKVLAVLIDSYPNDLTRTELCDLAGYSPDASTIDVIIGKLRSLGLMQKGARVLTDQFAEALAS